MAAELHTLATYSSNDLSSLLMLCKPIQSSLVPIHSFFTPIHLPYLIALYSHPFIFSSLLSSPLIQSWASLSSLSFSRYSLGAVISSGDTTPAPILSLLLPLTPTTSSSYVNSLPFIHPSILNIQYFVISQKPLITHC